GRHVGPQDVPAADHLRITHLAQPPAHKRLALLPRPRPTAPDAGPARLPRPRRLPLPVPPGVVTQPGHDVDTRFGHRGSDGYSNSSAVLFRDSATMQGIRWLLHANADQEYAYSRRVELIVLCSRITRPELQPVRPGSELGALEDDRTDSDR